MSKKVLIVLAEGFEEIEAVTPIDVLRRAEIEVLVAGLHEKVVTGSNGIKIETDFLLEEYEDGADAVILPGGMPGAMNLKQSEVLRLLIRKFNDEEKVVGAICAAPALALAGAGILEGKQATCYPGFEKNFSESTVHSEKRVVIDQNIVTSRGPGTAMEFSLQLVEQLVGAKKAEELKSKMLIQN